MNPFVFFSNMALHTLVYNRKQYVSLFLVCTMGVLIMLSASFVSDGMLRAVHKKAKVYYGGDLMLMGGNKDTRHLGDIPLLCSRLQEIVGDDVRFFSRIDLDATESQFFYEGMSVRLRMFKGVDFDDEAELFASFDFQEGSAASSPEHDTVLLSAYIARRLGVHAGDKVTLMMITEDSNFTNTMELRIGGIFADTSLFGAYTAYLDIQAMRTVGDYAPDHVNRLCMYYQRKEPGRKEALAVQEGLEKYYRLCPLTDDKHDVYEALRNYAVEDGILYGLVTLDANIKNLKLLIEAMTAVVFLVIAVLVIIISVGMGSTFRIIVMKRVTEIGTYRALGMKPTGVKLLFLTESFYLLVAGFIAGLLCALGISTLFSLIDFSFIPSFSIFLEGNHLLPSYKIAKSLLLFCIILVTTGLSMLFTIRHVVHISPVGAIATTA